MLQTESFHHFCSVFLTVWRQIDGETGSYKKRVFAKVNILSLHLDWVGFRVVYVWTAGSPILMTCFCKWKEEGWLPMHMIHTNCKSHGLCFTVKQDEINVIMDICLNLLWNNLDCWSIKKHQFGELFSNSIFPCV